MLALYISLHTAAFIITGALQHANDIKSSSRTVVNIGYRYIQLYIEMREMQKNIQALQEGPPCLQRPGSSRKTTGGTSLSYLFSRTLLDHRVFVPGGGIGPLVMESKGFKWNYAYLFARIPAIHCTMARNGNKETIEGVLVTIDCDTLTVGAVDRRTVTIHFSSFLAV